MIILPGKCGIASTCNYPSENKTIKTIWGTHMVSTIKYTDMYVNPYIPYGYKYRYFLNANVFEIQIVSKEFQIV